MRFYCLLVIGYAPACESEDERQARQDAALTDCWSCRAESAQHCSQVHFALGCVQLVNVVL